MRRDLNPFVLLSTLVVGMTSCLVSLPSMDDGSFLCNDSDDCAGDYTCAAGTCVPAEDCEDGKCSEVDCDSADPCGSNASCIRSPGGDHCECEEGFEQDGDQCRNINECASQTDDCSHLAACRDTFGGYECECYPGLTGDGYFCEGGHGSCAELLADQPHLASGTYSIFTSSGGPLQVHCDMATDLGAGYTMLRIDDSANLGHDQQEYRAACEALGLEVIVPRTKAHMNAIRQYNGGEAPNLINVFPKFDGAVGLENWEGRCQGAPCTFYVSDSRSASCNGFEPNNDNDIHNALHALSTTDCGGNGDWNDAYSEVVVQGWVICSVNDAGPATLANCQNYRGIDAVHNAGQEGITGTYLIDPDGPGNQDPFSIKCEMLSAGGGWTQMTMSYLSVLMPQPRAYLYGLGSAWYKSPETNLLWDWTSYQAVPGEYEYSSDGPDVESSFSCLDNEPGDWGLGCSNGSGTNWKCLPLGGGPKDEALGLATICQDQPDAFLGGCISGVQIWVRP